MDRFIEHGHANIRRPAVVAAALGLLAASLLLLTMGGFIQFNDASGFGSDDWVMPFGIEAGFAAVVSIAISLADRTARRVQGAALGVLDLALIVASVTDDGFRFIWHGSEGELFYLQVALGLGAFTLLTPSLFTSTRSVNQSRTARTISPWARAAVYLCVLVLAMFVASSPGSHTLDQ